MQGSQPPTMSQRDERQYSLLRLLNADVISDPHVLYRGLREHEPVHWDAYMHAWVVTGYAEVMGVLRDYSADRVPSCSYLDRIGLAFMKPFSEMMSKQMMFMDGAMHARLRGICSTAFTPRSIEGLANTIGAIADELLDKIATQGHLDLIADFANPLPATVTARLLGVPSEDSQQLHAWVLDLAEVFGNVQHHPDRIAKSVRSLEELKSLRRRQDGREARLSI